MDNMTNLLSWALILIGAAVTFLVKPFLVRSAGENPDEDAQKALDKKIYISKIIGMWLIIIGAAIIFIAGGLYGRH